ncbi:MAG: DUF664 domain-containing protein [Propionibacteriaceae bacterium]
MTWTAPPVEPVDEPFVGPERAILDGYLESYRLEFLRRCAGLTGLQLAEQSTPPSDLSLLALVRHLVDVERTWIRRRLAGQDLGPAYPPSFRELDPSQAEHDYAALLTEWELCRSVTATEPDLDRTFRHSRYGDMSLRWLYLHLIGEYAGHLGHADLLRERIDGVTFT